MKKIVVVGGGGLMGHGIAAACLQGADCEVTLLSRRLASAQRGVELIRTGPFGLERAVERGKLDGERAAQLLQRLHASSDYAGALAGADLVFESVPEVAVLKKSVLSEIETHVREGIAIASGTSAIMIAELAGAMSDPGRLVGTHWFYPANVMPLVEVARSELTRDAAFEGVTGWLRAIGKRPVAVADSPGFFMTRFVNTFIAEAIRLVELGVAGPAEIDEMVKTGLGWPMGVFELLDDTASFDSWYHAQAYLRETCGERYAVPPLARRVFEAGYLGAPRLKPSSRGGWYEFLGRARPPGKPRP